MPTLAAALLLPAVTARLFILPLPLPAESLDPQSALLAALVRRVSGPLARRRAASPASRFIPSGAPRLTSSVAERRVCVRVS